MITETEEKLIAAPAIMGLRRIPKKGIERTGGDGDADRVVNQGAKVPCSQGSSPVA